MIPLQIKQLLSIFEKYSDDEVRTEQILSAYPPHIVELAREAQATGIMPDVQAKPEPSLVVKQGGVLPYCECGKQLSLESVCPGCPKNIHLKDEDKWKSRLICNKCGYEEYFKESRDRKFQELKKAKEGQL